MMLSQDIIDTLRNTCPTAKYFSKYELLQLIDLHLDALDKAERIIEEGESTLTVREMTKNSYDQLAAKYYLEYLVTPFWRIFKKSTKLRLLRRYTVLRAIHDIMYISDK